MATAPFKLGVACLILTTIAAMPNMEDTSLEVSIFTVGDEALLECVVKHIDNYTVLWRKVDSEEKRIETLTAGNVRVTPDVRISILHEKDHETWLLSIDPALLSDTGDYICEVNTSPPLKIYKALRVVKPPTKQSPSLNYTECCQKNSVPPQCHTFCNFDSPPEDSADGNWHCSDHLQTITSCLTDGRDHMPCCVRENIPEICRSVCRGDYQMLTVLQHYSCSKFALPTLGCIAEGLELLPGPPKEMSAEAVSSTKLRLQWLPPHQPVKVTHYEISITQLHEFDENGMLKESEDGGNRESKVLLFDDHRNQTETVTTLTINGNRTEYVVENLNPLTMYEITAVSKNEHGSSVPTYSLRTLTLSPNHAPVVITDKTNVTLPDIRGCCEQQGVQLGRCLNILCDPSRADETRMTDIMICAPWANVTFECMAGGFDHSACCSERGVPDVCLDFCRGTIKRVDYRHFVCLEYMPQYSGCLLDHYGVIPGPPENFTLTSVHNHWALLRWDIPETLADTVEGYNLHWRNVSAFEDLQYNIITNVHSPYLLDDLKPGVRYEAYVVSENSYGVSQGSTRIVFSTTPLPVIPEEEENHTGYNETQCCFNAGLAEHCMPLCSYQMKMSDLELRAPVCFDSLHILLRCGAGGRDHTPCCERRQVNPVCLPYCAGRNLDSPYENAFACEPHIANIIQCMAEGSEILPDIPKNFEVTTVTPTSIHVQWDRLANDNYTTYRIYYEELEGIKTLHPANYTNDINVTSTTAILEKLQPGTRYSIYVVAANEHGYSLPSSILVVQTTLSGKNETKFKATLSPPYMVDIPFQTVDTLTISWKAPLHVPPDAYLSYIVYYQLAVDTSDLAHDGLAVATTFTSIVLRNLSVNAEYAVAVRARSGEGESDLSEIVMAWTDPAVPSLVHAPLVIPMGQIMEGTNVTILCIGTGIPVPTVSVYVNGNLMKEDIQRHVAYTIADIQRNITTVGCSADNGYGFSKQSWQDIRVGFKPTASTATKSVKGYEGQPIRLQCVVSGHPEPRVIWFKDAEEGQTVRAGSTVEIHFNRMLEEPSSYLASLVLKKASKSDEGKYFCKAENNFGNAFVSFDLMLNDQDIGTNVSDCCIQKGVSKECLDACAFDVDIEFALSRLKCLNDINKIMLCAADGRDHQQCCRQQGVPRMCTRWCRGYPVFNSPICLLAASRKIVNCFEEGRSVLPGIPQNVKTKFNLDGTIYLDWEKPVKNHEVVQWYRIFWRPVGTKEIFRNQTKETNFKIQGLKPGQTYEIYVRAGNHYGQSQSTKPAVVHITTTSEGEESTTAVKIAVGIVVTVLLLALIAVLAVFFFKLKCRPQVIKGVSFENPTYMKESITLQNTCSERTENGNVSDGIQKNTSEPQRAIANIYEEPKSCGQQG